MEAFQAAISKGMRDKKCKPCQSVGEHKPWALRTAESHRQTLKAIIGTGTGHRLHGACRGPVGVISYSVLGRGAPPSPKTQSQRGMNYWFCYSDQLALLLPRTLCRPTITLKGGGGGSSGQKGISTQASPPPCTSSLKLSPTSPRTGGQRETGPQCISNVWSQLVHSLPTVTLDLLTSKGRFSCRLQNSAAQSLSLGEAGFRGIWELLELLSFSLFPFELINVMIFGITFVCNCDRRCCCVEDCAGTMYSSLALFGI